ncbi:hypothetical protein [Veillonella sp.]
MSRLTDICANHYNIFFCEGRNEEDALKWLSEEEKLVVDINSCNFDNLRKLRTRKQRTKHLQEILRNDYDKPPALIYLLDSLKETITLPKEFREIPIYYIYTYPEFEILFVIHMNKWKEFNNLNPKPKVSEFAQELFVWDIKTEGSVKRVFEYEVNNLIEASKLLKVKYQKLRDLRNKNGIYDLCN